MKLTVLIALVTLLLVRRIQRSIGFQKYRESNLITRIVLFVLVGALLLSGSVINPSILIPDSIGIIGGLVLAYIATNHAKFEKRGNGLYFKTHIWVEVVIIALFIARFAYRMYMFKDLFQPDESPQDMQARMQTMRDPFTGAVIFAFCTYYIGYFAFILKEGKKALQE